MSYPNQIISSNQIIHHIMMGDQWQGLHHHESCHWSSYRKHHIKQLPGTSGHVKNLGSNRPSQASRWQTRAQRRAYPRRDIRRSSLPHTWFVKAIDVLQTWLGSTKLSGMQGLFWKKCSEISLRGWGSFAWLLVSAIHCLRPTQTDSFCPPVC